MREYELRASFRGMFRKVRAWKEFQTLPIQSDIDNFRKRLNSTCIEMKTDNGDIDQVASYLLTHLDLSAVEITDILDESGLVIYKNWP